MSIFAMYRSSVTVFAPLTRHVAASGRRRCSHTVYAVAAVETKTVKIGTRGSPLALAQAYMTRDKLQVSASSFEASTA